MDYIVETDPYSEAVITANTSVLLAVSYNTYYNVTVLARNCKGSTQTMRQIFYGKSEDCF